MDDQTSKSLPFETWRTEAERLLVADYCIDFEDAGFEECYLRKFNAQGVTPREFIDWLGEKHGLTHRREIEFRG